MKKFLYIISLIIVLIIVFTGCFSEKTPEQIEKDRLETIAQEEAETGLKRLDSPNLTDYEIALQLLVQGIQEDDASKICEAVGSPHVLADSDIYGWALQSGYDYIKNITNEELRIKSVKENATATIKLYRPDENPNNEEHGQTFISVYEDGRWIIEPETGVRKQFSFTAPSRDVSCGSVSLKDYATSVDAYGKWNFIIPRMIVAETMENFKVSTELGEFDAVMVNSGLGYVSIPELIVDMNEDQRNKYTGYAQAAFQLVFDMLKNGADKKQLSSVLVSEKIISDCYPQTETEKTTLAEKLATVTGVELYPGNPSGQYPDAYVYRVYKDNSVQMDIKLRILTTEGECRKLATVTIQKLNGEWKIANVVCTDDTNPFTDFSVFNPAW